MNSLSAIAGHEGDEDDWEREISGLRNENEVGVNLYREAVTILLSLHNLQSLSLLIFCFAGLVFSRPLTPPFL